MISYVFSGILIFLLAVICVLVYCIHNKNNYKICKSKKMLHGKTVIVTGGTAGIGYEVSLDFAFRGAKVIIACPFEEEGKTARDNIVKETQNENVIFKFLELKSFKSVQSFANDILSTEDRLDVLVNNAGISISRGKTADGLNDIVQVNYLSHFLLTLTLLPLLIKSGTKTDPSRIINTSSISHPRAFLNADDLNNRGLTQHHYYTRSKLLCAIFTRILARKLQGLNVVVFTSDPGLVGTTLYNSLPLGSLITKTVSLLCKNVYQGSQNTIFVSLSSSILDQSGGYFRNNKSEVPAYLARDDDVADRVWKSSLNLVKLTNKEVLEAVTVNKA